MSHILTWFQVTLKRIQQPGLVLSLYGILAIALLSPMSSAATLPAIPDFVPHLGHIIQAKLALDEGQLPIRVAPWQHQGWQYPVFQIYGQVLYTWAGAIYKFLTPHNPMLAALLLLWSALVMAGFFIYRTSLLVVRSPIAVTLAGFAYMAAPYFLVNIHARGAIAEAVAQGLLPVVIYYTVRCYTTPKHRYVIAGAVAWFCLIGTHLITFIYASLFIALWLGLVSIRGRRSEIVQTGRSLLRVMLSYVLGCLLSVYYLAPVILQTGLQIRSGGIGSPYGFSWLTPLPTLLQPTSLPPEPQLGIHQLNNTTPHLHAAVGWILMGAWLTVFYYYSIAKPRTSNLNRCDLISPLILVFGLAFLMTWSPFDLWQFLPNFLGITQYTYRLLSHLMWSGALLFAYALTLIFSYLEARHLVIGIFLIGLASSSYLPKLSSLPLTVEQLVQNPDLGYARDAYLYDVARLDLPTTTQKLPDLVDQTGYLRLNQEQQIDYSHPFDTPRLKLNAFVSSEWTGYAILLSTFVNGQLLTKTPLPIATSNSTGPELEIQLLPVESQPARLKFAVEAIANPVIGTAKTGGKLPQVQVQQVPTLQGLPASFRFMPLKSTQPAFQRKGLRIKGEVNISEPSNLVQLPFLYYPDLLEATLNNQKIPYAALPYKNYALVSLNVPQGRHQIRVRFTGLRWANSCSLLTAIAMLLYSTVIVIKRTKVRGRNLWENLLELKR